MTKVQTTFKLARELDGKDLQNINRVHAVYGFFATRVQSQNELFVEYDAARLSLKEVRGTLEEHGLPVV